MWGESKNNECRKAGFDRKTFYLNEKSQIKDADKAPRSARRKELSVSYWGECRDLEKPDTVENFVVVELGEEEDK